MARGRKRSFDPTIPAHIDQAALPAGFRWDKSGGGRWRVVERDDAGKQKTVTVAGARATLADLHAIAEQRAGKDAKGTVAAVCAAFRDSLRWSELSANTQDDYAHHHRLACDLQTKAGAFGHLMVDRLTVPAIQAMIELIAKGKPDSRPGAGDAVKPRPSTANHVQRTLRATFQWGIQHGHCKTNPAAGTRQARERKRNTMPQRDTFAAVLAFAKVRGQLAPRAAGAMPAYLAPAMEIAFLCRMRRIEVVALTDDHAMAEGVRIARVKGSRGNLTEWTPALRAAWAAAEDARARTLAQPRNRARPIPMAASARPLFVGSDGGQLSGRALSQALDRLVEAAEQAGIIQPGEGFSMHGLKHRGVTDTEGSRADKQAASGHKSAAMLDVYDHELVTVKPARAL